MNSMKLYNLPAYVKINVQTVRHEQDSKEVDIDISELNLQQSCILEQVINWKSS